MTRNNKCPDIPFETFCQVVESVYDCALDPSRWQQTIGMIGELCRSHYGLLGLIDLENKRCELTYHNGYDDHYRRLFEEKYAAMNPYISRLARTRYWLSTGVAWDDLYDPHVPSGRCPAATEELRNRCLTVSFG